MNNDGFRSIPPVNAIAALLEEQLTDHLSPEMCLVLSRQIQDRIRSELQRGIAKNPVTQMTKHVGELVHNLSSPKLQRVLNGTGIVIHTNLGRAPVSDRTANAMEMAASGAVALEIEPGSGQRGGRMDEVSSLLSLLTGAEHSLVVNNAAAVLLVLTALAADKHVAVSRAEAVEIGGGFRIPDVLAQSGATLVEVGTTNRTYAADFARAADQDAELFLKIHPSNFSIEGFVTSPTLAELREVADRFGVIVVEDLGSGSLVATEPYGIDHEPTVQESMQAGVNVVTFSGDKLLGGPQAGIISGGRQYIDRIAAHPLARAVRADKTTLAGVAETLRHYVRGDFEDSIPVWKFIAAPPHALRSRARSIADMLQTEKIDVAVVDTVNYVGGGSLPGQSLPGSALRLGTPSQCNVAELAQALRLASPTPVYGRIDENAAHIELRTILPADDNILVKSIHHALASLVH